MTGCPNGDLEGSGNGADAGMTAGCPDTDCGPVAVCRNETCVCADGYVRGPADGCIPKRGPTCGGERCGVGSRCIDDTCRCDPDYVRDGDTCKATEPSDPADRTRERVCRRWTNQRSGWSDELWAAAPSMTCDPGRLAPAVQRQAVQYLNLHRWLVGVGPVTAHPAYVDRAQACATALAAEDDGLTHEITPSFACHSEMSADGARNSNVVRGVDHPAESVELYVRDRGSPDLGHRRWLFNPEMKHTGFGQRDAYSCMYAVDDHRAAEPRDLYYPPPGYMPAEAFGGQWSFMSSKIDVTDAASVSVTAVDAEASVSAETIRVARGDYAGLATLAWTVSGVETGTTYRVDITGLGKHGGATRSYETTLITCR